MLILSVNQPNGDEVQQFTVCLTGEVAGGTMQPDGEETTEQAFFTPEAVAQMNLPLWYADMVQDALASSMPVFAHPFSAAKTIDQIGMVRPFIGHDRLITVGAMAVVLGADGRILTILRQDDQAWALPTGFCDLGENVAHTAVRETLEETGLHIKLNRLLGVYSGPNFQFTYPNGDKVQNVGALFLARVVGGQLNRASTEVAALGWQMPAEFLANATPRFQPFYALGLQSLDAGSFVC